LSLSKSNATFSLHSPYFHAGSSTIEGGKGGAKKAGSTANVWHKPLSAHRCRDRGAWLAACGDRHRNDGGDPW
jgi:hypothetical protein